MNKSIFFASLFCLAFLFSFAQDHSGKEISEYMNAANALVVLKNEQNIIPLQDLHQKKIAYLWMGEGEDGGLYETLTKYMPVAQLQVPYAEKTAWISKQKERYNLFIIGTTNQLSDKPKEPLAAIHPLLDGTQSIVVLLDDSDFITPLHPNILKATSLIYTPLISKYSASLTAQLIFGGVGTKATLKKAVLPYKKDAGIAVEGGLRLTYSPAELLGVHLDSLKVGIAKIVEEGLEAKAFPGCQVLVAKEGHVIYHETFGFHTYDSLKEVQTTDIYDFASLTKVTTSLPALMKLYGDNKFDLDAPLKEYFPYFKNSNKGNLSYRSMLAHNAKLRPWIPYWRGALKGNAKYPWKKKWSDTILNDYNFRSKTFQKDSSAEFSIRVSEDLWLHNQYKEKVIYKAIKKSPLNETPGYKYSGLLFYLLPEIVSTLSNSEFEAYLNEQFYHRIGAYTLSYNPTRFYPLSRIIPTEVDTFFRMKDLHGTVHDEGAAMMAGVSSNAGLFGSANDLAKLFQLYLNEGAFGGEQLIASKAVQEFTRCQYCEEGNRRGLGFDKPLIEYDEKASSVAKDASPSSFGHSGYTGTFAWADPEHQLVYIFFSNRVYPTRDNPRLYRLNIRPRIHQVIYDAMK